MCEHVVKRLPFLIRYVPDQYKTQQTCDKAILENGGTLKSVPDCFKDQQLCDKAVDNYSHTLGDKVADTHPSTIQLVLEWYKTQEMCYEAVH